MPLTTNANGTSQTVVSVPPPAGSPHAYIFNNGPNPAWLGGAGVSTSTGLELWPYSRMDLSTAAGTVWAVAGGNAMSPSGTVNAATTVGGTSITVASGGTAFTGGMTVVIEAGTPRQEISTVLSSNAGSVQTVSAMTYAHGSASVLSQYTPQVTTLIVHRGAT